MLNEFYSMSQSLEQCGLIAPSRHKDITQNPKQDGFILGIAEGGLISTIEFCPKERMTEIWNLNRGENGVSFPGFKIAKQLWINPTAKDAIEKLSKLKKEAGTTERISLLEHLCQTAEFSYPSFTKTQRQMLGKNLREFPKELKQFFDDVPPKFQAFSDLLARLTETSGDEHAFLKNLSEVGLKAAKEGRLSADGVMLLQNLLVGKWSEKEKRFTEEKTAIVFEPAHRTRYQCVVTHPDTRDFVNEKLQERMSGKSFAKGGKGAKQKTGIDSFQGHETELETRFPKLNLPAIAETILMSMSKDARCQTRYGLQESDIFPVGKASSQAMLNSLRELTKGEREGTTWRAVPNSEGKRDLLIAYLADKPDCPAKIACLFGEDDESELVEGLFEAMTTKVCDAIKGEPAISPDSLLRVLVISARDKGRKQIALNEVYQVKEILRAADEWKIAGANLPSILVSLPPKRGEKSKWVSPSCPAPADLFKGFNTQWMNQGTRSSWVSSCELGEIYGVFLKQTSQSQETAARLLSLILKRATDLLLAIGYRQHSKNWKNFPDGARLAALTVLPAIGILLYKTNHRKEAYMQQAPFNLGRLLSLADQLHQLYCKEVRDGDVPPQLLGNALMSTALQQPTTALALLGQRILPYHAWATKIQSGEKVGLAKYFLKEMGAIAQSLSNADLPATTTEAERAEMILGYLASAKTDSNQNAQAQPKREGDEK